MRSLTLFVALQHFASELREGFIPELYDVVALPGVVRPSLLGFRSDELRRTISVALV